MTNHHADYERVRKPLTYPLRRLGWWLRSPEPACLHYRCPRPRVGLSKWCRQHTDEILERRTDES
jgi:hypothetical protein